MNKINQKIISVAVKDNTVEVPKSTTVEMHEAIPRPHSLSGTTYKLKTPTMDHATYITINDIVLNEGTDSEQKRPFEVFINSKNMDNFQWIVALTRLISAVFRKGGDSNFMIEELQAVFDPKGGYFHKGKFIPSNVAAIANILETHMKQLGMLKDTDESLQKFIEEKKSILTTEQSNSYSLCNKCNSNNVVKLDGCNTCLSCGDSKCG